MNVYKCSWLRQTRMVEATSQLTHCATTTLLKMLCCLWRGVVPPDHRRRKRFHGDSCNTVRRTLRGLMLLSLNLLGKGLYLHVFLARYNLQFKHFHDSSSFRMCTQTYTHVLGCRLLITALKWFWQLWVLKPQLLQVHITVLTQQHECPMPCLSDSLP